MGCFKMIILDTHIWIWWVQNESRLTSQYRNWLTQYESEGLGISIFSSWEVAKLVEKGRLILPLPVESWLNIAASYPGVRLIDLTIPIIVQATQLKGFHNDPADQIIVATAKVYNCLLLTADHKILRYPDVQYLV
jgi:PIN domain nuclease of toxin-antitoxin system